MRMEIRGTASFFHSLLARGSNFKDNRVLPPPPPLCIPSLNSERHSSVHRPLFRRYLVRGEKKKKNVADDQRDGQSSLGQRSRATSNVRSRFLFHSFLSPIPHTFAPRLLFLSPFPLLSSRTRAHLVKSRRFGYTDIRPNNTDSTTTAQSKIGPM